MTRYDAPKGLEPAVLRRELIEELKLVPPFGVDYNPHEGWIEIDIDDDRVPGIIAGHTSDRKVLWPEWKRELYQLCEAERLSPTQESRIIELTPKFLKELMDREV